MTSPSRLVWYRMTPPLSWEEAGEACKLSIELYACIVVAEDWDQLVLSSVFITGDDEEEDGMDELDVSCVEEDDADCVTDAEEVLMINKLSVSLSGCLTINT